MALQFPASDSDLFVSATAPSAGAISSVTSLSKASSAVPIVGQAISAAVSILQSLLAGHAIRAKDAKNENSAMNQVIPFVTQAYLQLVADMGKGKYSQSEAQTVNANIMKGYNSFVQSLQGKPGIADNGGSTCNKQCTVGCCLRANYVEYLYTQVDSALRDLPVAQPIINPNGQTWVLGTTGIPPDKYGFTGVPAYKVPIVFVPSLGGVGGLTSGLTSEITALTGGKISPKIALVAIGLLVAGGVFYEMRR